MLWLDWSCGFGKDVKTEIHVSTICENFPSLVFRRNIALIIGTVVCLLKPLRLQIGNALTDPVILLGTQSSNYKTVSLDQVRAASKIVRDCLSYASIFA